MVDDDLEFAYFLLGFLEFAHLPTNIVSSDEICCRYGKTIFKTTVEVLFALILIVEG